jgi:hypothetical protein
MSIAEHIPPSIKDPASQTLLVSADQIVTKDDITKLKIAINKSLKEIVRLHLGQKSRLDAFEERITQFNTRSGQKI